MVLSLSIVFSVQQKHFSKYVNRFNTLHNCIIYVKKYLLI
jgi:hypothetical protein